MDHGSNSNQSMLFTHHAPRTTHHARQACKGSSRGSTIQKGLLRIAPAARSGSHVRGHAHRERVPPRQKKRNGGRGGRSHVGGGLRRAQLKGGLARRRNMTIFRSVSVSGSRREARRTLGGLAGERRPARADMAYPAEERAHCRMEALGGSRATCFEAGRRGQIGRPWATQPATLCSCMRWLQAPRLTGRAGRDDSRGGGQRSAGGARQRGRDTTQPASSFAVAAAATGGDVYTAEKAVVVVWRPWWWVTTAGRSQSARGQQPAASISFTTGLESSPWSPPTRSASTAKAKAPS